MKADHKPKHNIMVLDEIVSCKVDDTYTRNDLVDAIWTYLNVHRPLSQSVARTLVSKLEEITRKSHCKTLRGWMPTFSKIVDTCLDYANQRIDKYHYLDLAYKAMKTSVDMVDTTMSHKNPVKNENVRMGSVVRWEGDVYIVAANDPDRHAMTLIPMNSNNVSMHPTLNWPEGALGYEEVEWLANTVEDWLNGRFRRFLFGDLTT